MISSAFSIGKHRLTNGEIIYSYQLADVTVDLIHPTAVPGDMLISPSGSQAFQTQVPGHVQIPGNAVPFKAVFTNHLSSVQSFDYWIKINFADGREIIYDVHLDQQLDPLQSHTVNYNISIPSQVSAYTISAYVGEYPDDVLSFDDLTK